jgi:hypothetical protein
MGKGKLRAAVRHIVSKVRICEIETTQEASSGHGAGGTTTPALQLQLTLGDAPCRGNKEVTLASAPTADTAAAASALDLHLLAVTDPLPDPVMAEDVPNNMPEQSGTLQENGDSGTSSSGTSSSSSSTTATVTTTTSAAEQLRSLVGSNPAASGVPIVRRASRIPTTNTNSNTNTNTNTSKPGSITPILCLVDVRYHNDDKDRETGGLGSVVFLAFDVNSQVRSTLVAPMEEVLGLMDMTLDEQAQAREAPGLIQVPLLLQMVNGRLALDKGWWQRYQRYA